MLKLLLNHFVSLPHSDSISLIFLFYSNMCSSFSTLFFRHLHQKMEVFHDRLWPVGPWPNWVRGIFNYEQKKTHQSCIWPVADLDLCWRGSISPKNFWAPPLTQILPRFIQNAPPLYSIMLPPQWLIPFQIVVWYNSLCPRHPDLKSDT